MRKVLGTRTHQTSRMYNLGVGGNKIWIASAEWYSPKSGVDRMETIVSKAESEDGSWQEDSFHSSRHPPTVPCPFKSASIILHDGKRGGDVDVPQFLRQGAGQVVSACMCRA